jgi:hypothetical protein
MCFSNLELSKTLKKMPDIAANIAPACIFYQDELRAGTRTHTGRKWSPQGHRPYTPVRIGYESLYLYLALCPFSGQGFAAFLPRMTSGWFAWFVKRIDECVEGKHLMIADGSRTHSAAAFEDTQFVFSKLPPYCPELNPVERVFREVRSGLKGQVFATLDAAQERLTGVLTDLFTGGQTIINMTCFPYILNASI